MEGNTFKYICCELKTHVCMWLGDKSCFSRTIWRQSAVRILSREQAGFLSKGPNLDGTLNVCRDSIWGSEQTQDLDLDKLALAIFCRQVPLTEASVCSCIIKDNGV